MPQTPITSIDHVVRPYSTTLVVFSLFISNLLTVKVETKMITLFYRAESLCGNFVSRKFYKVALLCVPIILNLICGFITAIVLFFHLVHRHAVNGAFYRIVTIILPHAYVFSKVVHFIFCVSFVQFGFEHLSNIINSVNKK